MTRALLVLGASGQVASELARIGPEHDFLPSLVGRQTIDLTLVDAGAMLDRLGPGAVVNAAAYTGVDRAEQEVAAAFALNADTPGRFAAACAVREIPFVHISTDYVFDGTKKGPYVEDDPIRPLGAYGRSKAAGEARVQDAGGRSAIVRTAWVYSAFGANFVKTMLRLAAERDEISVVDDQLGSPTWAQDMAKAALLVAESLIRDRPPATAVFHAAGAGEASWADLAETTFEQSARRGGPSARVRRIATTQFPTTVARPANSRLSCERLQARLGWRPPAWRDSLSACLDELLSPPGG
jgi:dTDP-4-dehydrorhamnose reductase